MMSEKVDPFMVFGAIDTKPKILSLVDISLMTDCFSTLLGKIQEHHQQVTRKIQKMGAVVPSPTFWEKEELRYVHIMPHSSSKIVAPIREILQNSSDAGTRSLDIATMAVQLSEKDDEILKALGADSTFMICADTGKWCEENEYDTFHKCRKYFLYMNGSSKDGQSQNDGGFGVGRFVILFCSPVWFFTTRHMLVMGHYGSFQILCRQCRLKLKGVQCSHCQLHERDTPTGTTFLIHNKIFQQEYALQHYPILIRENYLRYCNVNFPIRLSKQNKKFHNIFKHVFPFILLFSRDWLVLSLVMSVLFLRDSCNREYCHCRKYVLLNIHHANTYHTNHNEIQWNLPNPKRLVYHKFHKVPNPHYRSNDHTDTR